jgi:hypothetical protein
MSIPHATGSGDAHDADERLSAAAFFIVKLDTVGFDDGHGLGGLIEGCVSIEKGNRSQW